MKKANSKNILNETCWLAIPPPSLVLASMHWHSCAEHLWPHPSHQAHLILVVKYLEHYPSKNLWRKQRSCNHNVQYLPILGKEWDVGNKGLKVKVIDNVLFLVLVWEYLFLILLFFYSRHICVWVGVCVHTHVYSFLGCVFFLHLNKCMCVSTLFCSHSSSGSPRPRFLLSPPTLVLLSGISAPLRVPCHSKNTWLSLQKWQCVVSKFWSQKVNSHPFWEKPVVMLWGISNSPGSTR